MADVTFTDQNFQQEVLESKTPVLVDFWAAWCVPCKIVSPIVEDFASEYKDTLKVGKVNVDENAEVSQKYGVMSIPSLLIFKDGKVVKTMVGAQSKDNFKKEIDSVLSS